MNEHTETMTEMKKKTPMQELILTFKKIQEAQDPFCIHQAIELAESMLREEKEQFIQAVYRGDEGESSYGSANDLEGFINARQEAEEWFERTYKHE